MKTFSSLFIIILLLQSLVPSATTATESSAPFLRSELIFPLEHWHNHASCIIETPQGDFLVCWFHGSGERTADDVRIEGARLQNGVWSPRFVMADTPGYPDTNPCLFVDPRLRLWLLWPTILANRWETALMKYRIATDYQAEGPPRWDAQEVLHVTPGKEFDSPVAAYLDQCEATLAKIGTPDARPERIEKYLKELRARAADKLSRRLGWMTRAHPLVLDQNRLLVPLYSDGFDLSLIAITDDWGTNWHTSQPLVAAGNIQPSLVRRRDGSLFALMRDNGPAPHRLHQSISLDRGETWSAVTDSDQPNPGSGAEVIGLRNGHWVLIGNDTEAGRYRLTVQLSEDEGKTWPWKRRLEADPAGPEAGAYHYPSIIQAQDGSLHASYSYHLNRKQVGSDSEGQPARKSIKHAHFNEAWIRLGDSGE